MQHEPVKLSVDESADQTNALRRIHRFYTIRCDVNRAMTRRLRRQEFLREICRILVEVGDFRSAWFEAPDAEGAMSTVAIYGDSAEDVQIPLSMFNPRHSSALDLGSKAVAGFPVQLPSGVVGALFVSSAASGFFAADEVTLLVDICADMAYALEFAETLSSHVVVSVNLGQEQNLFETLVCTIPDLVWLKAKDGLYLYCNPAFERFFGATREEIVGKSDYDFVDEDLAALFRMKDNEALAAGIPTKNEEWVTFADDGHRALLETVKTPMRDGSGPLLGILGIARDVTETHQVAELQAMHDMDNRFRVIFECANEGIIVADIETLMVFMVNPAACAMFGYSEEEFLRLCVTDVHPAESLPVVMSKFSALASGKITEMIAIPCLRRDGSVFYADIGPGRISLDGRNYLIGYFTDVTARLHFDEQLRESERKFRAVCTMAKDGIIMLDDQGRVTFWNEAAEQILGYSSDELTGCLFHPLIVPPSQGDSYVRGLKIFARTGTGEVVNKTVEFHARRKNGDELPVEVSISSFQLRGRWHAMGVLRDISERKRSQEALQEQAELLYRQQQSLSGIIYGANAGTWEWDIQSGAGVFNERWAEIIGYTLAELEPTGLHTFREHTQSDDYNRAFELFWRHLSGELDSYECEFRMRHKRGHWVWVQDRGKVVVWDVNGMPLLASGTHMDISKRKRAEEMLAASEKFMRVLTDFIPGMVGYWTNELRNGFANVAYLEWFGKTHDEMKGIHLRDLLGEEVYRANEPFVTAALRGERQSFERTLVKADGSTGYVWAHYIPSWDEDKVQGFFVLVSDITELKLVQLQLELVNRELAQRTVEAEAANRAKGEFLANMSHEIRTPMNAVIGLGNLALRIEDSAKRREYLTKMTTAAKGLQQLLTDLLDLSKIEAGKLSLMEVTFLLRPLVEQLIDLMEGNADEKGLRLTVAIDPDTPDCLVGDNFRIKQVLINLLGNAIKFTESGEVCLEIRPLSGSDGETVLEFIVRDSGIGMTPEQLAGIFEPFTQGDSTITRTHGGTGLGLSICRRLVHLMGGDIQVSSTSGAGSVFTFALKFMIGNPAHLDEHMTPTLMATAVSLIDRVSGEEILEQVGNSISGDEVVSVCREVDAMAVAALLHRLRGLLQKNSSQAKTLLPELRDLLQGTVLDADSRRLVTALAKFDFKHARSLVEQMASSLIHDAGTTGS